MYLSAGILRSVASRSPTNLERGGQVRSSVHSRSVVRVGCINPAFPDEAQRALGWVDPSGQTAAYSSEVRDNEEVVASQRATLAVAG